MRSGRWTRSPYPAFLEKFSSGSVPEKPLVIWGIHGWPGISISSEHRVDCAQVARALEHRRKRSTSSNESVLGYTRDVLQIPALRTKHLGDLLEAINSEVAAKNYHHRAPPWFCRHRVFGFGRVIQRSKSQEPETDHEYLSLPM